MAWVNKNFAYSTLNGGVLIGDLSIVVTTGANFPATGNFMLVIWDQAYANPSFDATRELVLCTARSTNTITITRAQEGTSAKAWNSGDKVAHVYTAAMLDAVVLLTGAQTLTDKTLTLPVISATGFTNANHAHAAANSGGTIAAAAISSGTLLHERGGLESDVSAANGLVKISGGVTSIVAAPSSTIVGISDSQALSGKTIAVEAWTNVSSLGLDWTEIKTTSYMKDPMGFVHLKGVAQHAGTDASHALYTLPSGYRPEQDIYCGLEHSNTSSDQYPVQITTAGVILTTFYPLTHGIVYLDGITFKAA